MNKKEYADYQERVALYLKGLEAVSTGANEKCPECEGQGSDPWFSWRPCEICGQEAGNREPWHALSDGELVHGSCCEDCIYYLAFGQLDDTTMMQIEKE